MPSSTRSVRRAGATLAGWRPSHWAAAAAGAALTAALVGIPTAVVPTPFFTRTVPTLWWNYPVLAATAVLGGLVLATYLREPPPPRPAAPAPEGPDGPDGPDAASAASATADRTANAAPGPDAHPGGRLGPVGGLLSFLAVGCPVCNKVVLLLVGASGAMSYWAPIQPLLALASLVLLAEAALRRLSTASACPLPTARTRARTGS